MAAIWVVSLQLESLQLKHEAMIKFDGRLCQFSHCFLMPCTQQLKLITGQPCFLQKYNLIGFALSLYVRYRCFHGFPIERYMLLLVYQRMITCTTQLEKKTNKGHYYEKNGLMREPKQ